MSVLRLCGRTRLALTAALVLAASGCGDDPGIILTPDGGHDAGQPDSGPVDAIAPRVIATDPPDGTIDVPANTAIEITFSEPMSTESDDLEVSADGTAITLGPLAWDDGGRILRAEPSAPLPEGPVQVVVGTGFIDEAGNPLAFEYVLSFEVRDAAPPHVTASTPAEGATDVSARVEEVVLDFDEPMDATTGELALEGGPGTALPIEWLTGTRARAALSGLTNATAYTLALTGFRDTAGNELDGAAVLGDGALDFTTRADDEGPRVIDASPAEGQVNVSLRTTAEIVVQFDEAMDTSITDATLEAGATSTTLHGTWSDDEIHFPVTGRLANDAAHSLDLSAFTDAAGNALEGAFYLSDGALDFRTGSDSGAPHVLYSDPVEGSSDRTYRQDVVIVVFDKPMDTSVTAFTIDDGTRTLDVTGSWNLSGTELRLNVIGLLHAGHTYRVDLSALQDMGGTAIEAADPYLRDAALDFTLAPPNGEQCRDALTTAQASSPSPGVFVWEVAPTAARIADGSSSCDETGIDADGVIAYTKTTASASAGGTVLRIRADAPTSSGLDIDVYANDCDPTGPSADGARLKCLWNNRTWEAYLDVGPGDYFIWFARNAGDFEGATITVEEVALPPEGESCLNPLTTSSATYTPPASGAPGSWTLAADSYFSYDMDVTWGGAGSMACDDDYAGGPITGNDAVIRIPKSSATSVLRVALENDSFTDINLEVLDACDPAATTTHSLVCENEIDSASPVETFIEGPAGDYYAWLASNTTSSRFPGGTLSVTEIEPVDGSTCSRARTIALAGPTTVPVNADITQRLYPPSCAADDATFTWYRFTAPEDLTLVTPNAAGAVALVDAASGRELTCLDGSATSAERMSAFVPAGTDVCIAIASGPAITSLELEPVAYDGIMGVPTDLNISRPLSSTGTERTITSMYWMTVTPTTIYAGISSTGILVAPRTGGTRADFYDMIDASQIGNTGVSVGEAVFGLDNSSSATTGLLRLFRYVDPLGTFGPVSWDMDFTWPADEFDALAYDGSQLIATNDWSSSVHTRFYAFDPNGSGPGTLLGEHPTLQGVGGLAADATWFYVQAHDGTSSSTEGVYRVSRADPTVAELLGLIPVDTSRAPLVLDSLTSPRYLYARDDDGNLHVFADPGGASPRHLGIVSTLGDSSDYAMAYDAVAGALILFESETVTTGRFVRLD